MKLNDVLGQFEIKVAVSHEKASVFHLDVCNTKLQVQ